MSRVEELGRYELKYVLPVAAKERIVERISGRALPDPFARSLGNGSFGYSVRTLYLDTPDLDDYFDRLDEQRVRNRLRVRTYGEPGEDHPVFVENKRKLERWVIKQRVKVCSTQTWLDLGDRQPWQELLLPARMNGSFAASHFRRLVDEGDRRPISLVHYNREVYVDQAAAHIRLTLDQQVSASVGLNTRDLFAPAAIDLLPAGWMVMELKFTSRLPGWMQEVCRSLRLHSVPVSKYGLSIAKGVRSHRPHEAWYLTPPPLRRNGAAIWT